MATFGILVLNEQCRPSIHSCQLMVLLIRCKTPSAVPKSKLTNFFSLFQILIKAQKSREKDLIALTGIYVKEGLECKLRPLSAKRGNSPTCILPCIATLCIVLFLAMQSSSSMGSNRWQFMHFAGLNFFISSSISCSFSSSIL